MRFTPGVRLCFLFAVAVSIASCNTQSSVNEKNEMDTVAEDEKGLSLMHRNCFTCHNPDRAHGMRVAPPMFMVRNHYYDTLITEEEFVDRIVQFVNNPSTDNSIMPGAVRNFGLMPKQMFRQEDLTAIAKYIYRNDMQSDEWYSKWENYRKTASVVDSSLSYEDRGLNIVNGTKSELGKNLLAAINERGTAGAVEFCNTRALLLTDSMSKVYNSSVRRVSDKPRNPGNAASETESEFISELKIKAAKGEKLAPKIFEHDGNVTGYYPILTNKMCLQCHGRKGADVDKLTLSKLSELYPDDKATGYGENEVRGIFVVEMKR